MEFSKKQTAVFYFQRNKGSLFVTGLEKQIDIKFAQDVIRNMEVLDSEKLAQVIKIALDENNIHASKIFIVAAEDVNFEHELKDTPVSLEHVEIDRFLDTIPFSQVLTKTFRIGKSAITIAINRDLADAFTNAFEKESFVVVSFTTNSVLRRIIPDFGEKIDPIQVGKKEDLIKQYSLLYTSGSQRPPFGTRDGASDPRFAVIMPALAVVLSIIIIILIVRLISKI